MNSCSGTPGENTFRYKLPKYVTKTSLTKATSNLKHSYEVFGKDSGLNPTDYLSNLLSDILPYVHADICRHFACITEFETHETIDHDDSRHIVIISEDGISQCPLCREAPATDNEGVGFCEQCLTLPDTIKSIQARLDRLELECDRGPIQENDMSPTNRSPTIVNHPGQCPKPQHECDTISDDPANSASPVSHAEVHTNRSDKAAVNNNSDELLAKQLNEYRAKHKQLFTAAHSSPRREPFDSRPNNDSQASQSSRPTSSNDQQSTSRSERTYTKADTLLIGDSMLKHIEPKKLSRRKIIWRKSIPGAKIDDAYEITKDLVEKHQVTEMIVHFGTNNLTTQDEPNEIVAKMSSFCDNLQNTCKELKTITISTIIHRRNATPSVRWKTHRVNADLKLLANQRAWNVIDNDFLNVDAHIAVDGVHLNSHGVKVFAQNIIQHIRSTVSAEDLPFRHRPDWHRRKKTPSGRMFPRDWMGCLHVLREHC